MRRKVHVLVTDNQGGLNEYVTPITKDGYFKQIQGWETAGFVKIIRANDTLLIPWERVVHCKVPHETSPDQSTSPSR